MCLAGLSVHSRHFEPVYHCHRCLAAPQSIHLVQVPPGVETQLCLLYRKFPVCSLLQFQEESCQVEEQYLTPELTMPGDGLGGLEGKRTGQRQSFVFLFGMVVSGEACIFL